MAANRSSDTHIKRTNPPTLAAPTGYTHVTEVAREARTVYIAGQVAYDWRREVVGVGDMAAQVEQVVVWHGGLSWHSAVSVRIGICQPCQDRASTPIS